MPVDLVNRRLVSVGLDHDDIETLLAGLMLTRHIKRHNDHDLSCRVSARKRRELGAKLEHAQRILAALPDG